MNIKLIQAVVYGAALGCAGYSTIKTLQDALNRRAKKISKDQKIEEYLLDLEALRRSYKRIMERIEGGVYDGNPLQVEKDIATLYESEKIFLRIK
jgi:hypothetical protein